MYFLNLILLHAGLLLTWYDSVLLFNIKVKKKNVLGVINVKLARKNEYPSSKNNHTQLK